MILAAFFIFAALGSFTLGPFTDYDYDEYEPLTADELAEEEAWLAGEREADLVDEDERAVTVDGRFL